MKIYTKGGDKGKTSLVDGSRVSKCSVRVCAYGDVDELISYIALLRCGLSEQHQALLRKIQENLMLGSAHLACSVPVDKLKNFDPSDIVVLEEEIDKLTSEIPPQTAFVLPARPTNAAHCHIARTICRRAERSSIAIEDKSDEDMLMIRYLNRLSDYLFTLARYQCYEEKVNEDFWIP